MPPTVARDGWCFRAYSKCSPDTNRAEQRLVAHPPSSQFERRDMVFRYTPVNVCGSRLRLFGQILLVVNNARARTVSGSSRLRNRRSTRIDCCRGRLPLFFRNTLGLVLGLKVRHPLLAHWADHPDQKFGVLAISPWALKSKPSLATKFCTKRQWERSPMWELGFTNGTHRPDGDSWSRLHWCLLRTVLVFSPVL